MKSRITYGQGQLNVERETSYVWPTTLQYVAHMMYQDLEQLTTMLSLNERGYVSFHTSNVSTLSPFHNPRVES